MDDYSDIIDLPHPNPKHHPRMPLEVRITQFLPYAALTNFHDEIDEVNSQIGGLTDLLNDSITIV